ncbi:methyltransferase domain-containing protein [Amycolatopsis nigrescens]|uniref:methyltransferase domain-containing protein n=1 Tax=Amycolatopsis nigrescens TaxID=381445 RepID=UPI00037B0B00|nr:methyltransferase domain-containing protein [Amycolatopsis nigrescens]
MSSGVFETSRPEDYLLRLAESEAGSYKRLALSLLDVEPGQVVLDLGCGPGTDLPAFAEAVTERGRVIGLDHDAESLAKARQRTARLGQVELLAGVLPAIDLPPESVDRAHTDRVLQHVADPAAVLGELRRVLRPGAKAVFAEPDWDTLAIDAPELEFARAYTRYVSDQVVRNAAIGRQLVRYAVGAGFEVPTVVPVTTVFRDVREADRVLGFERVTRRGVAAGHLPEAGAGRWLEHLATQPFFASATLYLVLAEVPTS